MGLVRAGIRHALAPVSIAKSLSEEVLEARDRGLLAGGLYDSYQEYWRFESPEGVDAPKTLVCVAWPSPLAKIRFETDEGPLDVLVPPTYISTAERSRCLDIVRSVLQPAGHVVDWARVPVKLLAVRTGLARYGRNNIAYVDGLGSHVRLGAMCTDAGLPITTDGAVQETAQVAGSGGRSPGLAFMGECEKCRACVRACPTGCIPDDGTVIDAAHCLTQANENEGPWPSWVPADGHNSLVGCMRCQEVCPMNRARVVSESGLVAEFGLQETDLILQGLPAECLPDGLRAKLEAIDLDGYSTVLGRNLRALRQAVSL